MRKGNSDRKLQRHHVNIGSTCRKLRRKAAASPSLSSISFVYLSPPRPRTHLSRDTSLPFSLLLACSASPLWMTSSANCKTTSRSPMSSCWWRDRLICRPTGSSSPPPRPSAMWCRPPRSYVHAAVPLPPRASSLTSSPPRLPPTHTQYQQLELQLRKSPGLELTYRPVLKQADADINAVRTAHHHRQLATDTPSPL